MTGTEIWPAIDLHGGNVVSLRKGKLQDSTLWNSNPLELAEKWQREGASGLHVIDLDAAIEDGSNRTAIESILRDAKIPVQVGGGIRSMDIAERWLTLGADRVILGTLAFENPTELRKIIATEGKGRVVVALDYRDEIIVTHGWVREQGLQVIEAAKNLEKAGVETILVTATEFDGMANGPDLNTLRTLHDSTTMHVLASGGIRTIQDAHELQEIGVEGVVVGRALYDHTLHLSDLKHGTW